MNLAQSCIISSPFLLVHVCIMLSCDIVRESKDLAVKFKR